MDGSPRLPDTDRRFTRDSYSYREQWQGLGDEFAWASWQDRQPVFDDVGGVVAGGWFSFSCAAGCELGHCGEHPPGVDLVQRMHPRTVLGREQDDVQQVVGVVEELAQAPGGGEGGGVDVEAEKAEELVVVEGGGARAPDAGEQGLGRRRGGRALRGIGRGGLGTHGGGERGFGGHDASMVGSEEGAARRLSTATGTAPSAGPGSVSLRCARRDRAAMPGERQAGGTCPRLSSNVGVAQHGRV